MCVCCVVVATNGHHGGSLDLASLAQSLNSQMTPSISMPPLSSDACMYSMPNLLVIVRMK